MVTDHTSFNTQRARTFVLLILVVGSVLSFSYDLLILDSGKSTPKPVQKALLYYAKLTEVFGVVDQTLPMLGMLHIACTVFKEHALRKASFVATKSLIFSGTPKQE